MPAFLDIMTAYADSMGLPSGAIHCIINLTPFSFEEIFMSIIDYFRKEDINAGIKEYRQTKGAMLVDVRTAEEYRSGHIPSAHNFPVENVKDIARLIPQKDTPVYLYCQSGRRAVRARDKMKSMGYTNVQAIGGIENYKGKTV